MLQISYRWRERLSAHHPHPPSSVRLGYPLPAYVCAFELQESENRVRTRVIDQDIDPPPELRRLPHLGLDRLPPLRYVERYRSEVLSERFVITICATAFNKRGEFF